MVVPFTGLRKTGEGTGFEGKINNFEHVKFERPCRTVKVIIDISYDLRVEVRDINFGVISI